MPIYGFIDPLEFYVSRFFEQQGERNLFMPRRGEEMQALRMLKMFSGQAGLVILPKEGTHIDNRNLIAHIRYTIDPSSQWQKTDDGPAGWQNPFIPTNARAADILTRVTSVSRSQIEMVHRQSYLHPDLDYEIEIRNICPKTDESNQDFLIATPIEAKSMSANFENGLCELVDFYLEWGGVFKALSFEEQQAYVDIYPHILAITNKYGFIDSEVHPDLVQLEDFVLPWLSTVVNQIPQQRTYSQYYGKGREEVIDSYRQRHDESEVLRSVLYTLLQRDEVNFTDLREETTRLHPDFAYNYQWLVAMLNTIQGMAPLPGLACNEKEGSQGVYKISPTIDSCERCFHRNLCPAGAIHKSRRRLDVVTKLFDDLSATLMADNPLQGHSRVLVIL